MGNKKSSIVRLHLRESDVIFDERWGPGVVAIVEVPVNVDDLSADVRQRLKEQIMNALFDAEFLPGRSLGDMGVALPLPQEPIPQ